MAGKIFTALSKIEAETHSSDGRIQEALNTYKTLLASSPNLTPDARKSIETKIKLLQIKLVRSAPRNRNHKYDNAIQKLQKAITRDKTLVDLRRSARNFYRQGLYSEALENLRLLVRQNAADEFCVIAVAGCILHLYKVEELAIAVDLFLTETFQNAKKAALFKMMLADKMAQKGYFKHAEALIRHKNRFKSVAQ
ncbi:MAG: hypothetical protein PVJ84_14320 [Desulfobacteraceae bacterium]|jgi:tetratricopeptide (TPR) repeat protein